MKESTEVKASADISIKQVGNSMKADSSSPEKDEESVKQN